MNQSDTLVDVLIRFFNYSKIYEAAGAYSGVLALAFGPVMTTLAVMIRAAESQTETLFGRPEWPRAIMAILVVIFAYVGYTGIFNYVVSFFNDIYSGLSGFGNLNMVMNKVARYIDKINAVLITKESDAIDFISSPVVFVAYISYLVSVGAVTTLYVFLRMALAISFCLAFLWGLITIPLAMTKHFRVLKGTLLMIAAVLVWPLVEYLLNGFLMYLMDDTLAQFTNKIASNTASYGTKADVYGVFIIINIILAVIMIVAPFLAWALVSNGNPIAPIATIFSAGALAANKMLVEKYLSAYQKGGSAIASMVGKNAGKLGKAAISGVKNGAKSAFNSFKPKPKPTPPHGFGRSHYYKPSGGGSQNSPPPPPPGRGHYYAGSRNNYRANSSGGEKGFNSGGTSKSTGSKASGNGFTSKAQNTSGNNRAGKSSTNPANMGNTSAHQSKTSFKYSTSRSPLHKFKEPNTAAERKKMTDYRQENSGADKDSQQERQKSEKRRLQEKRYFMMKNHNKKRERDKQ